MKNILVALFVLFALKSYSQTLKPEEAKNHVNDTVTVCGKVVATHKMASSNVLLDFGKPYPDNVFTVIIFGRDYPKFNAAENTLKGKNICVKGKVILANDKPEIVLSDTSQLKVSK
jgi:hypothetical protein